MRDFKWPNPKPSSMHDNHYMTFKEMSNLECDEYLTGNQGLPSNLETGTLWEKDMEDGASLPIHH